MPSVMGLLEERERAVRQQVEALQAELREAEAVLERVVIARETVGQVLAEPRCGQAVPLVVTDGPPVPVAGAVPGSVVPVWRDGLDAGVLAPDYRRIMNIVADSARSGGEAMDCRQLAAALGLAPLPAKVEGVRVKAKRLAARGWLTQDRPGLFSAAGRGGGS
jgi:DNA-directed RNA polymerase subunit H (RpoH/RPB5)